jgi:hypothetical protein
MPDVMRHIEGAQATHLFCFVLRLLAHWFLAVVRHCHAVRTMNVPRSAAEWYAVGMICAMHQMAKQVNHQRRGDAQHEHGSHWACEAAAISITNAMYGHGDVLASPGCRQRCSGLALRAALAF